MNKKRILLLLIVAAVLGALVYFQFRTWQKFDWRTFGRVTGDLDPIRIGLAIGIIYCTYVLRALRWKIFLRPVCDARFARMIGPQFVGFTGLAMLGRPGELIRPYLIARKENLTFSSQVAVWAVERIFDIGAFAVLMAIDVFAFSGRFALPPNFRVTILDHAIPFVILLKVFGGLLLAAVAAMAWAAYKVRSNADGVARWMESRLSPVSHKFAGIVCHKIRAFGSGLNTIHDRTALLQLIGVSLTIWLFIAVAYREVLHGYPSEIAPRLHAMHVHDVLLLMGASMVGSVLQLPALGGGSQLATIGVLSSAIFNVPREQAASAGIMLWLITFVACVPVGLIFAHFEHISFRKITHETEQEEQKEEALEDQ